MFRILWVDDDWLSTGSTSEDNKRLIDWEADWSSSLEAVGKTPKFVRRGSSSIADDLTRGHFDLLICDYMLSEDEPGGERNAIELLDRLRAGIHRALPPAVIFTRYPPEELTAHIRRTGDLLRGVFQKTQDGARQLGKFISTLASRGPVNLLVISDLHMGYLPRESSSRGEIAQREFSDRLADGVRSVAANLELHALICPGDFAWHDQREDFKHATIEIGRIMTAARLSMPDQFLFCPGNHDVVFADGEPHWREFQDFVRLLGGPRGESFFERFVCAWNPLFRTLNDFDSQSALLSIAQLEGPGIFFAGINSVKPTLERFKCSASVDDRQWEYIKKLIERRTVPGLRVAAIHHPIFASPGGFWGNEVPLIDQGKVLQRLRTLGFSLVFHGHTHFAGVHEHRVRIMNHPGASRASDGGRISSILTVACPSVVAEPDPASPMRQFMVVKLGALDPGSGLRAISIQSYVFDPSPARWIPGESIDVGQHWIQTDEECPDPPKSA